MPALAGFDHAMQTFIQANGVRAAQLAIAKNGVTKLSRAYMWAEAGYRVTQPSDRLSSTRAIDPPSTSPTLEELGNSITHLLDTTPLP